MGGKAILIVVIGFGLILGYFSLNMSSMATRAVDNMSLYAAATESHNLATTGANVGLAKFYEDTSWRGSLTQSFTGTGAFRGSFNINMQDVAGGDLRLRSISSYPVSAFESLHDTIEVYFDGTGENGFELFGWMTDFNGNDDFWYGGDTLWGRIHSNGNLHMQGTPVFWDKVTTSKGLNPKPSTADSAAMFKGGYETGIAEIPFPTNLAQLIAAGLAPEGRSYPGEIWVTLSGGTAGDEDGFAYIRATSGGPIIDSVALSDPGFNGVILGGARVNVQGTVDGQLTIASSTSNIFIQDNILYENPNTTPSQVTTSNDVLGLVAESNVFIADNAANHNNLIIHASIFARNVTFAAENLNGLPVCGELHVRGSIVQKDRGHMAKFAGPTLQKGFHKRYRYDDRLANINFRPPYYPGYEVSTYAIKNWWESVRIPEFH
jgi:hypothetical protein